MVKPGVFEHPSVEGDRFKQRRIDKNNRDRAKSAKRNVKRLIARCMAAQKASALNYLPRCLAAREFKFNVNGRSTVNTATKVRSDALSALNEICQTTIVTLMQKEAAAMRKAGKVQLTGDGLREMAASLGIGAVPKRSQKAIIA